MLSSDKASADWKRTRARLEVTAVAAAVLLPCLLWVVPVRGGTLGSESLTPDELPKVNPDGWTSARVCGECHEAIYAVWRQSLHANAWSNGVFQAARKRSIDAYGEEKSRLCLSCHAPTVRHGADYEVKDPITAEGVTCDFCHSVSSVDLSDKTNPIRTIPGSTKYGPLQHAQSPAHQIIDSPLHTKSEFCAPCHEYVNANGVTVLGTYSEWKSSSYAKRGTQCQDCHMPLVPGRVVSLGIKSDTPTSVNLHNISGSHDIERVRSAVTMQVEGYDWIRDRVSVYIQVANVGSGHCFPTGLPMHRALLEVSIHDGGTLVGRRELPFQLVLLDKQGRPLHREHEVFVEAARVRSDTRLKPNEIKTLDVTFRNITAPRLVVTAALYYEYTTETLVVVDDKEHIEPVAMRFLIASRKESMKPLGR